MSKEAKQYWRDFGVKCLENLVSVKVWFFMFPFIASVVLLSVLIGWHLDFIQVSLEAIVKAEHQDKLVPILQEMNTITNMFIAWCTFTVSLGGTIIVIRETFKVRKLTSLNDEKRDNSEAIERIKT